MANHRHMTNLLSLCVAILLCAAAPLAGTGDSRIADAAMGGDITAVRALVQQHADVNGAESDGMTALHWAAEHGYADLAHEGRRWRATERQHERTSMSNNRH